MPLGGLTFFCLMYGVAIALERQIGRHKPAWRQVAGGGDVFIDRRDVESTPTNESFAMWLPLVIRISERELSELGVDTRDVSTSCFPRVGVSHQKGRGFIQGGGGDATLKKRVVKTNAK